MDEYTLFRHKFMHQFQRNEVKVYILVEYPDQGDKPIIISIGRLRLGLEIMPISAWLDKEKAEQCCRNFVRDPKCKVLEVSHNELLDMLEQQRYPSDYPKFSSYHLAFQTSLEEEKNFLDQSK